MPEATDDAGEPYLQGHRRWFAAHPAQGMRLRRRVADEFSIRRAGRRQTPRSHGPAPPGAQGAFRSAAASCVPPSGALSCMSSRRCRRLRRASASTSSLCIAPTGRVGAPSCGRADCGSAGKTTSHSPWLSRCQIETSRRFAPGRTKSPDAETVGLATGASGLVVIDVDAKAGRRVFENWANLVADAHRRARRRRCVRHVHRDDAPRAGSASTTVPASTTSPAGAGKLDEGIDVRAKEATSSSRRRWSSGVPYRYLDGHGPERLRDLPDVLADLLIAPARRRRGGTAPP